MNRSGRVGITLRHIVRPDNPSASVEGVARKIFHRSRGSSFANVTSCAARKPAVLALPVHTLDQAAENRSSVHSGAIATD
jgi:hypothetical protein